MTSPHSPLDRGHFDPVSVSILDREFLVACTPEERPGLIAAASYLDGKMREVRAAAAPGLDRIAVLAALNIAHELLALKSGERERAPVGGTARTQALKHKLEGVLSTSVK